MINTLFVFERNEPEEPSSNRPGTQLNEAHAQLLEKLKPIAFVETCQFLTIRPLEFQEIWPKTSLEPK